MLLPRPPRRVRYNSRYWNWRNIYQFGLGSLTLIFAGLSIAADQPWTALAIILATIVTIALVWLGSIARRQHEILRNWVETLGEIKAVRHAATSSSSLALSNYQLIVEVHYAISNDAAYRADIALGTQRAVVVDQPIRILYDPKDPTKVILPSVLTLVDIDDTPDPLVAGTSAPLEVKPEPLDIRVDSD